MLTARSRVQAQLTLMSSQEQLVEKLSFKKLAVLASNIVM